MRDAMAQAPVGDDVFDEDPTVHALQTEAAALVGKEAALYCPTGCMTNQLAITVQAGTGDEVIVEEDAHIYNYETTAASALSRVQLRPVRAQKHGILSVDDVRGAVRERAYYMPLTKLIAIENTHNRAGGTIYPLETIKEISDFAHHSGIAMHLDGARLWNACAATGISPAEYAQYFDTVSICFSKGLGAPVGSAFCGSAEAVAKARRARKIWGGGMRQAGIIAAGALYALRNNRDRVIEDNRNAKRFAEIFAASSGNIHIDLEAVQSNIVLIDISKTGKSMEEHAAAIATRGVRLSAGKPGMLRAVTHLDVSREQCEEAGRIVSDYFAS